MNFSSLLCYLDDLLVFTPMEEEALSKLEIVFHRLRMHRLKLSPKKCQFLRDSVKFFGHIISEMAISWIPTKTSLGKRPQLQITRKSIQRRTVTKQRPKALKPVPVIQFSSRSFPKDVIADRSPTNQEPHRSYAEAETQSK
ncbi:hypothetical protein QQF64_020420 [Cirrhinus molitorella]|uniref:ribonuclease H n=1 Tax=Cirrhinus molitorella TaxID=172907 RepID=A0ABR3LAK8_9TELE